jgi:hypothetical protein
MTSRDRLAFALIGLVQGIVFWYAHEYSPEAGAGRALVMAAAFFAGAAGLVAHVVWTGSSPSRLAAIALGLGALVAALTWWVFAQVPAPGARYEGDAFRIFTWSCAAFLTLYVLVPFAQIFQRTGRFEFPYRDLSFHAWTNFFVGVMGAIYVAVFFILTRLWGALFDLIGIRLFSNIFESSGFNYLSLATVFGLGLAAGREGARFTDAGRTAALAVFRLLMPLLATILLLFVGTLPFTGLTALWETGYASALLLSLSALVVLFLNAVFEDGERPPPYTPMLRHWVEASVVALPIVGAITAYSIWLRVDQYGLSPDRVYAIVFCLVTNLFALGYAAAVFRRHAPWMGLLRPLNVALALTVVAIALLLHTSALDPLRWSARNQVARLLEGRVPADQFDFASLRFKLGHVGDEALARLETDTRHPAHTTIARRIDLARKLAFYEAEPGGREITDDDLRALTPLSAVPEGFALHLDDDWNMQYRDACVPANPCLVFAIDFDADGALEHCVAAPPGRYADKPTLCFSRTPEGWRQIGNLVSDAGGSVAPSELLAGGAKTSAPRYSEVKIGKRFFRLVP